MKNSKTKKSFKATSSKSVVHAGRKIFGNCHLETGNNRIKLDRKYNRQIGTGLDRESTDSIGPESFKINRNQKFSLEIKSKWIFRNPSIQHLYLTNL